MNELAPQLVAGAGVQGELIRVEDLPDSFYHEEEHPGLGAPSYTADRFFAKRPDDYRNCVACLAAGYGLLKIGRLLKVHHQTVAAVRDREGAAIDIEKEKIRKNIRTAVGIGSERLPDIMANLAAGQMPLAMAILIDKLRDMDGEPTQRVEVNHRVHLTHAAVAAQIEAFPDAIEVETTMHHQPGERAQKGSDVSTAQPSKTDDQSANKHA